MSGNNLGTIHIFVANKLSGYESNSIYPKIRQQK